MKEISPNRQCKFRTHFSLIKYINRSFEQRVLSFVRRSFKGRQGSCISVGVSTFPAGQSRSAPQNRRKVDVMTSKFLSRNGEIYRVLIENEDACWTISFDNPMERPLCIAASEMNSFRRVPAPQDFVPEECDLSLAAQKRLALIQRLLDVDAITACCGSTPNPFSAPWPGLAARSGTERCCPCSAWSRK